MGNRAAQVERPCLLPPGFGAPGPALPRPSNAPNDAQHEAIVHRRELRRAALLKRQVAGMEASPSMLTPAAAEVRDSILAAGPDTGEIETAKGNWLTHSNGAIDCKQNRGKQCDCR
jgi:hypothetical protein